MLSRIFFPFLFGLLLIGILSGLSRGGIFLFFEDFFARVALYHPVIFISGFFGSLLSIERAIGLRKNFLFVIPVSLILGVLLLITFGNPYLLVASSLLFSIPSIIVFRMGKHLFYFLFSSVLFFLGNLFFVSGGMRSGALALAESLVFYVLAERIELARIIKLKVSDILLFVLAFFAVLVGAFLLYFNEINSRFFPSSDNFPFYLIGFADLYLGMWFLLKDVAKRVIKISGGLSRYSALAILLGHFSLLLGGFFLFFGKWRFWGESIHFMTLGFTFSMVFGHAPLIFPQILKIKPFFSRALYFPLSLLHFSVFIRFLSAFFHNLKTLALSLNSLSILIFFIMMGALSILQKTPEPHK